MTAPHSKIVAIIGAGLAGTALAAALKHAGVTPVIYETSGTIAAGASGNDLGMVNPRFTALRTPESDYFTSAFAYARTRFVEMSDVDWNPCGALHLITDEKKQKRYPQTVQNWGWDRDDMRIVTAAEASKIAGIDISYDALYLPGAGYVSPCKLCETYAQGIEIHLNHTVDSLTDIKADAIVIASSVASKNFAETADLPIKPVRGQVTQINENHHSKHLKCNIHYGGYLAQSHNGVHMLGATFQPWLDHSKVLLEDNEANIEKMGEFIPALKEQKRGDYEIAGNRASIRCASKDHFPIVGQVTDNLYVSTAHGSHGILSSLMAAELLTDMILDRPRCLSIETIKALSSKRFV